ncbi:Lon protease family protein [Thermoanaerobacterium thermosaccharolyticum]|uniref:Lon protease family protein n=1 Tax=Thermoanaerobacterium thermosaccharolyticum TaxID=1517 RepID=UPI001239C898|nr:ATP-binding protein [Thermoanaerobacterium thermosaccharolyticum]KAA5808045.1 AAA family ATPase [Thermoanaerobacterium thermosaccharolyticum]
MRELSANELKKCIDPNLFNFETTETIKPLEGLIGQERAKESMEFGLKIKQKGYNIFITGLTGTGKSSFALNSVNKIAPLEKVPDDWVYVFNFDKPSQPIAINLKPGDGRQFQNDMRDFVEQLQREVPKAFNSKSYDLQKNEIVKKFQDRKNELIQELNELAKNFGFVLKETKTGIVSIPVIDGKQISNEEYEQLEDEKRKEIETKAVNFEEKALQIWKDIQNIDKETRDAIHELDNNVGLFAVGHLIDDLREKYGNYNSVMKYLDSVQKDILENLDNFRSDDDEDNQFPFIIKRNKKDFLKKYSVNLFVDNSRTNGAPVVVEYNPNYNNVLGSIEYESDFGVAITDFTKIKAGALHKANGGYLILQAKDILTYPYVWDALKRTLKTDKIAIENVTSSYGLLSISSLKPEPIELNVKVILIGTPYLYYILYNYDDDFKKLFKVKVDFNDVMELNDENISKMASFIKKHCIEDKLRQFHNTGVAKVIEYSTRISEDKNKLTTQFNDIVEILYESNIWAEIDESEVVMAKHVEKAIKEKIKRVNMIEEKYIDYFKDGTFLIDVDGEKVGVVNGLSVINLGDYRFGKPSRITVTTYPGEEGVVNIERETKMSGHIHDKGVMIITGFIGNRYALDFPLTLSARICFEQLYEGVEGDSASSTELYGLLSSLADVPIKQGIAVTGSVNQFGVIQPVGGVTHKIEGFYKLCKVKGLTGDQGVIIPEQNVNNLVLDDEVIDACRKRKFHIYTVKTIDEGMEILTGEKMSVINERVKSKLKSFYDILTRDKESANKERNV